MFAVDDDDDGFRSMGRMLNRMEEERVVKRSNEEEYEVKRFWLEWELVG